MKLKLELGAVARLNCHGDACEAWFEALLSAEIELRDFTTLLARAASCERWLFVLGKPYCPTCAYALTASLSTGARGQWANAIKMGIVERAHMQRVEVESR